MVATTEESVFFFLRRRLLASCLRCSNVSVLLLFPDPVRPFPVPVVAFVWPPPVEVAEATEEVLLLVVVVLPFSESLFSRNFVELLVDFSPSPETEVATPTCF